MTTHTTDKFNIASIIKTALEHETTRLLEKEIAETEKRISSELKKSIAKIVIGVMSHYSIEHIRDEIVIRVKNGEQS